MATLGVTTLLRCLICYRRVIYSGENLATAGVGVASWTESMGGNAKSAILATTVTVNEAGWWRARVLVATDTAIYVDPKVTIT